MSQQLDIWDRFLALLYSEEGTREDRDYPFSFDLGPQPRVPSETFLEGLDSETRIQVAGVFVRTSPPPTSTTSSRSRYRMSEPAYNQDYAKEIEMSFDGTDRYNAPIDEREDNPVYDGWNLTEMHEDIFSSEAADEEAIGLPATQATAASIRKGVEAALRFGGYSNLDGRRMAARLCGDDVKLLETVVTKVTWNKE